MTRTMSIVPVILGLLLTAASVAGAQTLTPQPDVGAYLSLGIAAQPQKRSFGSGGTFPSFNETGRFEVNQNIGAGGVFDIAGGYQFWKHLAAGVSVWTARSKSAVSAAASIPDPVFFGRFTTVNATGITDQKQSTLGLNLFVTYTMPVADRFDVAVSLGPTIVKTKLDVGSVVVAPNSQTVTLSSASQSKTTAKAGNFALDFTFRINEMYSVGIFGRYAGGEADLPAVKKLKVGGVQAGALIRYRF